MLRRSLKHNKSLNKPSFTPVNLNLLQRKCDCGKCSQCDRHNSASQYSESSQAPPVMHEVLRSGAMPLGLSPLPLIQPKLKIGEPNDKYEQEADRVAEQVMRMPESGFESQIDRKDKQYNLLQTKPLIQRRVTDPNSASEAPSIVNEVLRSPGQPLDRNTRSFMESRFGHDFSQVRVHTDDKAAKSAQSVNALAFTVGQNVVFNSRQYAPEKTSGKCLLAHELAHVAQQSCLSSNTMQSHLGIGFVQNRTEIGTNFVAKGIFDKDAGFSLPPIDRELTAFKLRRQAPASQQETINEPNSSEYHSGTLSYREATELIECIRIMGEENSAYCRHEVLGEPMPLVPTYHQLSGIEPSTADSDACVPPTSVRLVRTYPLDLSSYRSGGGICAVMEVLPTNNLCSVGIEEDVQYADSGSTCPRTLVEGGCSGSSTFTAGRNQVRICREVAMPTTGFVDRHSVNISGISVLHDATRNPNNLDRCTSICAQRYFIRRRTNSIPLGQFQIRYEFTKGTRNGREVTNVTAVKTRVI